MIGNAISGLFGGPIPTTISVEYLVVGGGAGGGYQRGAGGGAGGFRTGTLATLGLLTNYTVTCGAGGTGNSGSSGGGAGNNSVFSSITSTGGGGGGYYETIGNNGGSGGGGGFVEPGHGTRSGGSGTTNQGYANNKVSNLIKAGNTVPAGCYSNSLLSTNDFGNRNDIVVYPNPTVETVNINSINNAINSVAVYSLDGKLVATYRNPMTSDSYSINVQNLATGIYTLKVETNNGSFTKRIIVRR